MGSQATGPFAQTLRQATQRSVAPVAGSFSTSIGYSITRGMEAEVSGGPFGIPNNPPTGKLHQVLSSPVFTMQRLVHGAER